MVASTSNANRPDAPALHNGTLRCGGHRLRRGPPIGSTYNLGLVKSAPSVSCQRHVSPLTMGRLGVTVGSSLAPTARVAPTLLQDFSCYPHPVIAERPLQIRKKVLSAWRS